MISETRIRYHRDVSTLVPTGRPHEEDVDDLRARLAELEPLLRDRHAEVAQTRADLDTFRIRYRQDVGLLHEELDRLELALAEAELGVLTGRLGGVAATAADPQPVERADAAPKFTSDAIRKLFRDVAKAIHPDLAEDDDGRDCRHALMVAANRAYELGDEEQLRLILLAWQRSPHAVPGADVDAVRLRLIRRLAQVEQQLETLAGDLAGLRDTSLWRLKAMVDDEARKGKDLIKDMVRRLKRDILVTTNRLHAITG
jgi:hypothetical protein